MYPEYSLRESNFVVIVLGTQNITGGFADPFKPITTTTKEQEWTTTKEQDWNTIEQSM